MKRVKSLIGAILGLLFAVVACAYSCFAWFSINKNVSTSGLGATVFSTYIEDMNISAYKVEQSADGVYKIERDEKGNEIPLSSMPSFGLFNKITAVIVKLTFKYTGREEGNIRLQVLSSRGIGGDGQSINNAYGGKPSNNVYQSYLSDSVYFYSASREGDNFTINGDKLSLVEQNKNMGKKEVATNIFVKSSSNKAPATITQYFIMDYDAELINYIYVNSTYVKADGSLQKGLGVTAHLNFADDLIFAALQGDNQPILRTFSIHES